EALAGWGWFGGGGAASATTDGRGARGSRIFASGRMASWEVPAAACSRRSPSPAALAELAGAGVVLSAVAAVICRRFAAGRFLLRLTFNTIDKHNRIVAATATGVAQRGVRFSPLP